MAVPFELQGSMPGGGTSKAEVYNPRVDNRGGASGLTVYTRERDEASLKFIPFLNASFGNGMNQDGSFGGSPVIINDGTDTAAWTGSNIIGGKVTFNSADVKPGWPPNGTKSVKIDNPGVGDVWQFAKGSSQDLSAYVAISMNVYIDKDWTVGDSVSFFGYDTGGAAMVGNEVLLENYVDEFNFDVVQTAIIPLADLGLENQIVDSFRFEQMSKSGKAAKFYLDDIQIEETGEPIEFNTNHAVNTLYRVDKITATIAGPLPGTLADGAGMTPLSFDKLLGLSSLINGVELRTVVDGVIDFSATINDIGDFLSLGFIIVNSGSDGTNSFITLEQQFASPMIIRGPTELNHLSIVINDDLTSLLRFTAALTGVQIFT